MSEIINGGDLMIFVHTSAGYRPIAFATSHKMSINRETVEITSKNSFGNWVQKAPRKISWSMTTENLFSQPWSGTPNKDGLSPEYLFQALVEGTELIIYIDKGSKVTEDGALTGDDVFSYYGKAIVTSYELNAPNGDNATYSATFEGVGSLVIQET